MQRKQLLLPILVVVMFGCAPDSRLTEQQLYQTTVSPEATYITSTNTPYPEKTEEYPTRTLTETPSTLTPTMNSFKPKSINCYKLTNWEQSHMGSLEGSIVLNGDYYNTPSFLYDIKHDRKIAIPQNKDEVLRGFSVSPNHKWLAYENKNLKSKTSELVIMASDGKILTSLDWNPSWRHIAEWLNNENLLISNNQGPKKIDSLIVFNPFTKAERELQPNYPDIWQIWIENSLNWGGFFSSGTIYSSDLGRVIFPYRDENGSGIILWNLQNQQKISSQSGGFGNYPKWRPDGEGFVVDLSVRYADNAQLGEEFFYMTRWGQIEQITNFNKTEGEVSIGLFNWSHDGERIAFLLNQANISDYPDDYPNSPLDKSNRLFIFDLENKNIIDSCIPGDESGSAPIWSPDGKYIVMEDLINTGFPQKGRVFLVDIMREIVFVIAENAIPIGWMQPFSR